ncbi:MAG: TetR/AcrR family transcriptional regulator [Pseudomonadota bacterium]
MSTTAPKAIDAKSSKVPHNDLRREKTRERLKAGAFEAMLRMGFHETKITDITESAGVATGTFYNHYPDKETLVTELIKERMQADMDRVYSGPHTGDAFDDILIPTRRFFEIIREVGPINRVFLPAIEAIPELREAWQNLNTDLAKRIAAGAARRESGFATTEVGRLLAAHAVQELIDAMGMKYFTWQDPAIKYLGGSPDAFAERISILCYRLLYGGDPPSEKIKFAQDLLFLPR